MFLKRCKLDNNNLFSFKLESGLLDSQLFSFCNFLFSKKDVERVFQNYRTFLLDTSLNGFNIDTTDSEFGSMFKNTFPISDTFGNVNVEYISSRIQFPKYTDSYAIEKSLNYDVSFYATFRMILYTTDDQTGISEVSLIKDQEVFLCKVPLMTPNCSFILNGVERVVVSQIHRAPGIFFKNSQGGGYESRVVPEYGSWIDFELSDDGRVFIKIGKKRKITLPVFLSAFSFTSFEAYKSFSDCFSVVKFNNEFVKIEKLSHFSSLRKLTVDIYDSSFQILKKNGSKFKSSLLDSGDSFYIKIADLDSYKILFKEKVLLLSADLFSQISNGEKFDLIDSYSDYTPSFVLSGELDDNFPSRTEAIRDFLKSIVIVQGYNDDELDGIFTKIFMNKQSFSLSEIGRYKMNLVLGVDVDINEYLLTKIDIIQIIKNLFRARSENEVFLDTDSLSNRRIRMCGELLSGRVSIAMNKVLRIALDKMNSHNIFSLIPSDIFNSSLLQAAVNEFFLLSGSSQFAEQTNVLSDLVHKRKFTALGSGGLTKDRATFDVRDVHHSHYGKICPIETPEGANIGLINSPAVYAKLNKYGFLTTPYRIVKDSVLTDEIEYLDSDAEYLSYIMQADSNNFSTRAGKTKILHDMVVCRNRGEFVTMKSSNVTHVDASMGQVVSLSANLIPFIESDDAGRASMGSNMQKQAVPLNIPSEPIIGTGYEKEVVKNSTVCVKALRDGIVHDVVGNTVIVRTTDTKNPFDIYNLSRFKKTNHGTVFINKLLTSVGQRISAGDIIADTSSVNRGELALGRNVLIAFMPWNGYNYEDAILVSERIALSNEFTSLHVEEFEISIRDTKMGQEQITNKIPNMEDYLLRHLDESGIVTIGSKVQSGDVLVGKLTPKADDVLTPEEKILRALFGTQASGMKNNSLVVPIGMDGVVTDVKIFTRSGMKQIETQREFDAKNEQKRTKTLKSQILAAKKTFVEKIEEILLENSVEIDKNLLESEKWSDIFKAKFKSQIVSDKISELSLDYAEVIKKINLFFELDSSSSVPSSSLPPGVLMIVKVYIAKELKLQPGDKMCGRHGNKGVISKILPTSNMPFMPDGTPIDIVLNPLGIASRMNVGQVMEVHLGFAAYTLGKRMYKMMLDGKKRTEIQKYFFEILGDSVNLEYKKAFELATDTQFYELISIWQDGVMFEAPVFNGIKEQEISGILSRLGLDPNGQIQLRDGSTGENFLRPVTVGIMYMLKLHHLVQNKVHARSTGSYSLVTQQPLGGKANFGGQRFGEMECWALQAYGAAYNLREMLTVKSDDINGRAAVYDSIIRGKSSFNIGMPESFNVMVKELRALCINIELCSENEFLA